MFGAQRHSIAIVGGKGEHRRDVEAAGAGEIDETAQALRRAGYAEQEAFVVIERGTGRR
ncbi:MAG: hypothetical protein U1E25_09715 [Methylocystis sp.]